METPGSNISYHDLSSLNELRSLAKKDEKEAVRQAAKQFESVFMGMLLASMRKANKAFEQDNPLNSNNSEFFRDMHDQQLSTELSKNGALGLADLMVKQLSPEPTPGKLQRHLTMPNQLGTEKTLVMPSQHQKEFALPPQSAAFKQLDPERIVLNVQRTKIPTLQLAPEHAVTEAATALTATVSAAPQVQKLGEETLWQPHAVTRVKSVSSELNAAKSQSAPLSQSPVQALADNENVDDEPMQFVKQLLPAARVAAKELGLEPMALLAQAALETGWGKKIFRAADGAQSHNLFGIKASPSWTGQVAVVDTLEYRQGSAQREKAKFRVYDNAEQSMQDYVAFIKNNPRYQQALSSTTDAKSYFRQLQAAGYATDPNYAQKLTAVFEGATFNQVRKLLANQLND